MSEILKDSQEKMESGDAGDWEGLKDAVDYNENLKNIQNYQKLHQLDREYGFRAIQDDHYNPEVSYVQVDRDNYDGRALVKMEQTCAEDVDYWDEKFDFDKEDVEIKEKLEEAEKMQELLKEAKNRMFLGDMKDKSIEAVLYVMRNERGKKLEDLDEGNEYDMCAKEEDMIAALQDRAGVARKEVMESEKK